MWLGYFKLYCIPIIAINNDRFLLSIMRRGLGRGIPLSLAFS
jgi:hypothetical protein